MNQQIVTSAGMPPVLTPTHIPWQRLISAFNRMSPRIVVAFSITLCLAIGTFDYVTPSEITLSPFYLIAVCLSAWFAGARVGALMAALCVTVWVGGDLLNGIKYKDLVAPLWNSGLRFMAYLFIITILVRLRDLQLHLEQSVSERTAALTGEMEERIRLEHELVGISEREQRRIGQDLHDSVCQHFTATAFAGHILANKLMSYGLAEANDAREVVNLIERGTTLSRQLAHGLNPIPEGSDGLMRALEEFTESITNIYGIECVLECEYPVLLDDAIIGSHLYRITQEAVANAIKHGNAKSINVDIEMSDEALLLQISDNGAGMNASVKTATGMGLRIMSQRARTIGGHLTIIDRPSRGTTVRCVLPVSAMTGA